MSRFYDYKCEQNHIEEYYEPVDADKEKHICSICGSEMKRAISKPYFRVKKGLKVKDIPHSKRRAMWNSGDPKDAMSLTY